MKNFRYLLIAFCVFFTILSCNNDTKSKSKPSVKETDFKALVTDWNVAHNKKDIELFKKLYAANVVFYQTDLSRDECAEKKNTLLQKYSDFKQTIEGKITIEKISETEVKCSFTKKASWNGKTEQFPSYLIFTKIGNEWKITTEGDLVTDANLENIAKTSSEKVNISFGNKKTSMWLNYPAFPKNQTEENFGQCDGPCNCYIQFSDPSIPAIKVESCIGGTPVNEGDLTGDGFDEVGILPSWWSSCWRDYIVYSLKNGKWQILIGVTTHCNLWDEGVDCVSKDKSKPGYLIVKYSEFTDDGIITKTKSVKVN